MPEVRNGGLRLNEAPRIGVDFKEVLAAQYHIEDDPPFNLYWRQLHGADAPSRAPDSAL